MGFFAHVEDLEKSVRFCYANVGVSKSFRKLFRLSAFTIFSLEIEAFMRSCLLTCKLVSKCGEGIGCDL